MAITNKSRMYPREVDPKFVPIKKVTSKHIQTALKFRYRSKEKTYEQFAYFDEMRFKTGGSYRTKLPDGAIDGWAMAVWPMDGFSCYSFEIKVSRGDFMSELKNPKKREPAMNISNFFYFVTPPDIIKIAELPEGCGHMLFDPTNGILTIKVPAERRDMEPLTMAQLAAVLRRQCRYETHESPELDEKKTT